MRRNLSPGHETRGPKTRFNGVHRFDDPAVRRLLYQRNTDVWYGNVGCCCVVACNHLTMGIGLYTSILRLRYLTVLTGYVAPWVEDTHPVCGSVGLGY